MHVPTKTARDGNNFETVRAYAKRKAKQTGYAYYVIFEREYTGDYHAVTEVELDTFYCGNNQIEYCTLDDWNTK